MLKRLVTNMWAAAVLVLVSSCGGGGGSDFAPPAPQPDPGDLPITSANAKSITESVLVAVTSTTDIISVVDMFGIPILGDGNRGAVAGYRKTVFTQTLPCDAGQIYATWTDEDDDFVYSTGDSFEFDFQGCYSAEDGVTLDGIATLTDLVITGDPENQIAPWSLQLVFGYEQMTGTEDDGFSATMNGAFGFSVSTDDNLIYDLEVTTGSFTVEAMGESETLSQFTESQRVDINAQMMIVTADGVLTSTAFNGSVEFETLMDFEAMIDDNPYQGQLLITDPTSSVLLTVIDNLSVRLEIDENKDGAIDDTLTVAWSEFDID